MLGVATTRSGSGEVRPKASDACSGLWNIDRASAGRLVMNLMVVFLTGSLM